MTHDHVDHDTLDAGCPHCSRRGLLRTGLGVTAAAAATAVAPGLALAGGPPNAAPAALPDPYQGRPLPMPIPYINPENGQHTFGPVPFNEPSNIDNFRGDVAVANIMGTGRDGAGTPLVYGGPSMDLRFQRGEYVTMDGVHHQGTFVHI